MKGLLLKEIFTLKSFARILGLLLVVYVGLGMFTGQIGFLGPVLMLMCAMLPMTSIALDDQAGWNAYVQCTPVSRRQQMAAKYLMVLIVAVAMCALMLVVTLVASLLNPVDWSGTLIGIGFSLGMALLTTAVLMPAVVKFGVEKARLMVMLVAMGGMIAFTSLLGDNASMLMSGALRVLPYVLPPVAIVLFVLSLLLSTRLYEAKEF